MSAANAKMVRSVWDEDRLEEVSGGVQVMCNFLPWSHTYGANAILHNMTDWGGTLYLDWGAPTPARLPEMIRNMKEISTTQHTTVPAAWAALATELERDADLAETFFERICCMCYGGAAMGQDIYERIQNVAVRVTGKRISLAAGYGATETAPTIMNVHWATERMGLLGLPLPGIDIKLVPSGSKLEVRVKGDCITTGYYKNPEKTADAFDEEGFYKLGDAAKFVDPENPAEGLVFDGRVVEDFKLSTGTWVSAGRLRVQTVENSNGLLQDALVAGLDRAYVGILGFPNIAACQACANEQGLSAEELVRHPKVLETLAEGLRSHNQANPGSSTRIKRALLMVEPPSVDKGELTDKGYINQSTALARRDDLVQKLYAETPGNDVVVL